MLLYFYLEMLFGFCSLRFDKNTVLLKGMLNLIMKYGDVETRTIKVDGYFEIPRNMLQLEFLDTLIKFLESFGAAFGGKISETPEKFE